jgi:16S rRNA (adenine1518-N6/adenine1519-N6)-dimethyltransferase
MNLSSPAAVSALLKRHRFLPAHRLGQNFLVDANVLAKIVAAGELEPADRVIEVGTGLGVLTAALAEQVGARGSVVTIERDDRLRAIHAETISESAYPQVKRVYGDALEVDLSGIEPEHPGPRPAAVIANIPYSITSPLLARLLEHVPSYRAIVLLVQKEVGDRLAAKPATSDYGAFTLFAQFHADVEILGSVSPSVFFPSPKVTSAIVRLRPRPAPVLVSNRVLFFAIVQAAFQQRRKTLGNALSSERLGWEKAAALDVLAKARIDPGRRGETLSIAEFAAIERSWTAGQGAG